MVTYRVEIVTIARLRVHLPSSSGWVFWCSFRAEVCAAQDMHNQNWLQSKHARGTVPFERVWPQWEHMLAELELITDWMIGASLDVSLSVSLKSINSDSPSLEYNSIRGFIALAFFAGVLGRGFQDSRSADFVGELTTSIIFLSTFAFLENFSCNPITILWARKAE